MDMIMTDKQKTNLRFCAMSAYCAKEMRHPQEVMMALGIDYAKAVPQSIADQWWFFDCQNVPAELPKFLSALELPESTIKKWME